MPGLEIDGTRAHLHGVASFKRQHVSTECALWVMLGARAPYPVYTRHTRRVHGVYPAYLLAPSSPPSRWPPHCSIHTVFGTGARAVHCCGPQRYRGVEGCAHLYRGNGGVSCTCYMRTCARWPSLRFLNVRYRPTLRRPTATTASKLNPWPRPRAWHAMPRPRLASGPVLPPPLGFLHAVAAARLTLVSSRVSDTS